MGAYFSLREATEWERTVRESLEPSIWTTASFTPLMRERKTLLQRPNTLEFSFPSGLKHGDDMIEVSDSSQLSLLVGFDEARGRLYSGLLLHAPQLDSPHRYNRGRSEPTSPAQQEQKNISVEEASFLGMSQELDFSLGGTAWSYMLLYAVKEGVLIYFSEDLESCQEVIREIATPEVAPVAEGGPAAATTATSSLPKCLQYLVGPAPTPVCRALVGVVGADLDRSFAVNFEPEAQANFTNCVWFCMRVMSGLRLSVRGYEICRVCEENAELGPIAGEAVSTAWERLWKHVQV